MTPINKSFANKLEVHHLVNGATRDFVGDYSAAPVEAVFTPPNPERPFLMTHFTVLIEDVGKMNSGFYGNSVVLTNGIHIYSEDANGNVLVDILDDDVIYTNSDMAHFAEDIHLVNWGQGNDHLIAHFEFWSQWGVPLYIPKGGRFVLTLNDDFTGLARHEFHLLGITG